jgi:hypothetical protein
LTTHFIAAPRVIALDKALANNGAATLDCDKNRRYLESESGCLRCKSRGSRASARTSYLECVFAAAEAA